MNKLDLNRINEYASYKVEVEENDYIFETDHNIQYGVSFDPDNANDQQAMRSRLFLRWFNAYGQQAEYYTRTEMIKDEAEENYIAIIVKRTHPQLPTIIDVFDKQIAMFRANKPE